MPYIGYNVTNAGSFALIDDIASTFNGSNTAFTLQVGGVNITPNVQNLIISIDGVVQQAPDAYSVSGSTITFTEAPASGADFYGILMGQSSYVENNSITADELAVSGDGSSGQLLSSDGDGTFSWLSSSSITSVGTLSSLTLGGDLTLPQKIVHSGDTDTYLSFGTDSLSLYTGGTNVVDFIYGNIYLKGNNKALVGYTSGGGAKELIKIDSSDVVQIGEGLNTTFAGAIIQSMSNPYTRMIDTSSGGDDYGLNNNGSKFSIYNWTDGREELYFGGDGNAIFTGSLGIGTANPSDQLTISNSGEASVAIIGSAGVGGGDATLYLVENTTDYGIRMRYDGGDDKLYINADEDTRNLMTIKRDGTGVGIKEASPDSLLHISSVGDNSHCITMDQSGRKNAIGNYYSSGSTLSQMQFYMSDGNTNGNTNVRMRLFSGGELLVNRDSNPGGVINSNTMNGRWGIMVDDTYGNNAFIDFRDAGSSIGNITIVSGNVSYNTFIGSHYSSLTTDNEDDIEIGTVLSTIDETHTRHLAKFKVSDVVGDTRVYGVFAGWDGMYEGEGTQATVSALGATEIRVTGACEGGDLLESNGDGTAKVQDDDIIRSKTIGKVTIGDSDTGVKLVSCVLYCG